MQLFEWDGSFLTGNALVDDQHKQLVNLINRFGNSLFNDGSSDPVNIHKTCTELIEYANQHFTEEERLMAWAGLDKRHLLEHHKQHEDLVSQIGPMRQHVLAGDLAAGKYMFDFLVNWLVFHILGTDMLMARQMNAIEHGVASEETFLAEETESKSNKPLLSAVKKLLHQISQRNKELAELNNNLEQKIEERTAALRKANHKLKELASTDVLTGLMNRRAFMEEAQAKFKLAKRYQRPLSFLMIDIDHFKRVNDTYGHQAGDVALVETSKTIKNCLRETDILGRIGGEEFAVILPETGLKQTTELTERLLEQVWSTKILIENEIELTLTISIGVATVPPWTIDVDIVMNEADRALYNAKSEGRNRCCVAAPEEQLQT